MLGNCWYYSYWVLCCYILVGVTVQSFIGVVHIHMFTEELPRCRALVPDVDFTGL